MKKKIPTIVVRQNEKIVDVMKRNSHIIIDYITEAIENALETQSDSVEIFNVSFETGLPDTKFKLNKNKWSMFLTRMMNESAKVENFELAAKIKKILEKIENNQKTNQS